MRDLLLKVQLVFWSFLLPSCLSYQNYYQTAYKRISGYRLTSHVLSIHNVSDVLDCGMQCSVTPGCQSYNYQRKPKPQRCELNRKTKEEAPVDFQLDDKYNYYKRNPCVPNPCKNGGTCQDIGSSNFTCNYVPLGSQSKNPAQSCKDVNDSVVGVLDGPQWIDPGNSGTSFRVYCDMTTDGGGWILVSNIVIPNPVQKPPLDLTSSFRDVSNYNNNHTLMSATDLRELQQLMPFTQLRFQCYQKAVGRMLHIITSQDSKGSAVVDYFTAKTNDRPFACDSFTRGPGDNSMLAQKCVGWVKGKWGHFKRRNENRMYDHAFYVAGTYHWHIKNGNFNCDGRITKLSSGDFWKIYVR